MLFVFHKVQRPMQKCTYFLISSWKLKQTWFNFSLQTSYKENRNGLISAPKIQIRNNIMANLFSNFNMSLYFIDGAEICLEILCVSPKPDCVWQSVNGYQKLFILTSTLKYICFFHWSIWDTILFKKNFPILHLKLINLYKP